MIRLPSPMFLYEVGSAVYLVEKWDGWNDEL